MLEHSGRHRTVPKTAPGLLPVALAGMMLACTCLAAPASDRPGATLPPIAVVVDVRPGLCPNHLRLESLLTIPVAVLGTMDFDVTNIDPTTVRLSRDGLTGDCAPLDWAYADIGTPVIGSSPECNDPRGDGLDDLCLVFSIPDLGVALGLGHLSGETVPLTLSGKLVTGQPIQGIDYAVLISGPWGNGRPTDEVGLLPTQEGKLAYYTNTTDHITLAIYDERGRPMATLVDADRSPGIYQAVWPSAGPDGHTTPPGTYFARITNSVTGTTNKLTLPE
ncbi:MAG TPA: hypothetical protein VMU02_07435 [bacterium]|nr:hypothetical protein [bacterium]